jgi:hypothetical protein
MWNLGSPLGNRLSFFFGFVVICLLPLAWVESWMWMGCARAVRLYLEMVV